MKKKVLSVLVIGLLAVALVIFVGKNIRNVAEDETEVIAQIEGAGTESSDIEIIGEDSTQKTEGDFLAEDHLINELGAVDAETTWTENQVTDGGNKINTSLGNDLSHDNSITSNSGVDIPVLNKFNDAGLDPDCATDDGMQDWFGYVGDEDAPGYQNVTACADAMNELTDALDISGGFMPLGDHISFSFTDVYAETGDLELRRDLENGCYIIGINYDMSDSESFYSVEAGKDVLTLLCSVISSTPSELAEFLYEESFVVEECMTSETTWVTVGDCRVQWGGYDSNGEDVLVYRVKAK